MPKRIFEKRVNNNTKKAEKCVFLSKRKEKKVRKIIEKIRKMC